MFGWHAALFPSRYSGMNKITVANWRQGDEQMQVVSGAFGHEKVHNKITLNAISLMVCQKKSVSLHDI